MSLGDFVSDLFIIAPLNIVYHLIEVVEHSCSITSLQLGETLGSVTKDMDTYTYREPLGVCAGITPFNFPAMIPLWVRKIFDVGKRNAV